MLQIDVSGRRVVTWGESLRITAECAIVFVGKHGVARTVEITGSNADTVSSWRDGELPGVTATIEMARHDKAAFRALIDAAGEGRMPWFVTALETKNAPDEPS